MAKRKKNIGVISNALSLTVCPWRSNNQVQLHINAEAFFPAMLEGIKQARHYILLEMYLFESGIVATQFIENFVEAANRGVKVYLLLDDYGCRGLKAKDRKLLEHDNIAINYYNPLRYGAYRRNLFRDHRKILVIDQTAAYIGGAGITDEFRTFDKFNPGWRETMIEVRGNCVPDWVTAFCHVWELYDKIELTSKQNNQTNADRNTRCRVVCGLGSGRQSIKKSIVNQIRGSQKQCWIATAYFVPSFKIRRALYRAAQRGIDVRLLLPGPISDHPAIRLAARRFYYNLLRAGVKIYEYQPRFMHQKVILCDDWVSIGSSNIDRWNFRWNLEANQEIDSLDFSQQVKTMFQHDFEHSKLYQFETWEKRSWYHRLQEWFWGHVDRFVDRYIR